MPISNQLNSSKWEHLYPKASHFMNVNGHQLHYLDQGHGTSVVMVHGNPTWSFYYRDLFRVLASDFRCIAPDHIGCGLSEKPTSDDYGFQLKDRLADFTTFLDKLDLKEPITLIAHDWGGMIAMAWAVVNPDKVNRIILMNTAAFLPPKAKKLPWQLHLLRNIPTFARPAILNFNLFAKGALYLAATRKMTAAVKAGYLAPYNTPRNRLATLRFVQDIPVNPQDPGYKIVQKTGERLDRLSSHPCLLVWGGRDFVFDREYFDEWRKRFPQAEAHYFKEAGHYFLEDEGERAIALIKRFMEIRN